MQWVTAAALVVIATCLVLRLDERAAGTAWAQPVAHAGARGVFAFTGQLTKSSFGLFMVDLDASNIWCYEYDTGQKPALLKLVAARSWKYDRFLDNFNTTPSPEEIEQMVEEYRRRALQKASQTGGS